MSSRFVSAAAAFAVLAGGSALVSPITTAEAASCADQLRVYAQESRLIEAGSAKAAAKPYYLAASRAASQGNEAGCLTSLANASTALRQGSLNDQ